jgi:hypothetical protein
MQEMGYASKDSGIRWVKASERNPTEEGYYHTKGAEMNGYWHQRWKRLIPVIILFKNVYRSPK